MCSGYLCVCVCLSGDAFLHCCSYFYSYVTLRNVWGYHLVVHLEIIFKSVIWFRHYGIIHVCIHYKVVAAEGKMLASDCLYSLCCWFKWICCDVLQVEIIGRLSNRHQRDQYLSALLNGSPTVDIQLTEAAKVIVMLVAIDAYENFISGIEVSSPVIIWQIFGRESSHSAERFFHEHVNCVGDTAILGEDKVRLFLIT